MLVAVIINPENKNNMSCRIVHVVCCNSLVEIAGSNPTGGMDVSLFRVSCAEFSARGRSLIQRSRTACYVSERDLEASAITSPDPLGLSRLDKQ